LAPLWRANTHLALALRSRTCTQALRRRVSRLTILGSRISPEQVLKRPTEGTAGRSRKPHGPECPPGGMVVDDGFDGVVVVVVVVLTSDPT